MPFHREKKRYMQRKLGMLMQLGLVHISQLLWPSFLEKKTTFENGMINVGLKQ